MFVSVTSLSLFTSLAYQSGEAECATLLDKAYTGRVLAEASVTIGSLFTVFPCATASVSGRDELELAFSRVPRKA